MVLELQRQVYMTETSATSGGQSNVSNTTSQINVPVGQADLGAPVDMALTNNTSTNQAETTIRTEGEVYRTIEDLANRYGLSKDDVLNSIKKLVNNSVEELKNIENKEFNQLIKDLEFIFNECKINGEINKDLLNKNLTNYNIALQTGWSVKGFSDWQKNHQKSTLSERLIDTNCLKEPLDPNDPEYDAKMEVAIEKFFKKTLLSQITPNTSQEERAKIYKAQLQTFGRLLVNTDNERDKALLATAIDKLYKTNIVPAAKANFQAMETEEGRAQVASNINKDYNDIVLKENKCERGVYFTPEQSQELRHLVTSNMDIDDIQTDLQTRNDEANEFFEVNKEILAIIDEKIKNGEQLTNKELKIQRERENLHIAGYAGAFTGIANNQNSTVITHKEDLLTQVNSDAYEIGKKAGNDFYREVMTEVVEYVEKHPEALTMPEDDFKELMDKVTDGNYSTVINDIKNGTTTELNVPSNEQKYSNKATAEDTASQNATSNYLGYSQPEVAPSVNPEIKRDALYLANNNKETEEEPVREQTTEELSRGGVENIKKHIKDFNKNACVVAIKLLNMSTSLPPSVKGWALCQLDRLNDGLKVKNIELINNNKNKIEAMGLVDSVPALQDIACNNALVSNARDELIKEKEKITV